MPNTAKCILLISMMVIAVRASQSGNFSSYMAVNMQSGTLILVVTSINALAYNLIHNYLIKITSAVTTTVIGEVKIVGIMLLSAFLLGGALPPATPLVSRAC
jgi:hypothetical protein